MSAFLGPIHYWLYNKVQNQLDLVENITVLAEERWGISLKAKLQEQYGLAERRPLEQVIENDNIHGWLQQQVSGAEYRLALCVTEILKEDKERLEELKLIFNKSGKDRANALGQELNVAEIYKGISDSWLDGMPCDHAYVVIEQTEENITFKRNRCVHEPYWEAVGGSISDYYALRGAWLEGFLEIQKGTINQIDEVTYRIKKGE